MPVQKGDARYRPIPPAPKSKASKPLRNTGGTFSLGLPGQGGAGFHPAKIPVVVSKPRPQAPYRTGQSPAEKNVKALQSNPDLSVNVVRTDTGAQKHAATMALQRMLNAQGYHVAVDGVYGPQTTAAYNSYKNRIHATQVQAHDFSRGTSLEAAMTQVNAERVAEAKARADAIKFAQPTLTSVPKHTANPAAGEFGYVKPPAGHPAWQPYFAPGTATEPGEFGQTQAKPLPDPTQNVAIDQFTGYSPEQAQESSRLHNQNTTVAGRVFEGTAASIGHPFSDLSRIAQGYAPLTASSVVSDVAQIASWGIGVGAVGRDITEHTVTRAEQAAQAALDKGGTQLDAASAARDVVAQANPRIAKTMRAMYRSPARKDTIAAVKATVTDSNEQKQVVKFLDIAAQNAAAKGENIHEAYTRLRSEVRQGAPAGVPASAERQGGARAALEQHLRHNPDPELQDIAKTLDATVTEGSPSPETLFRKDPFIKAAITLRKEGNILHVGAGTDLSSYVHEAAHALQHKIAPNMDPETFARSLEQWVHDGKASDPKVQNVLDTLSPRMKETYGGARVPGESLTPHLAEQIDAYFNGTLQGTSDAQRVLGLLAQADHHPEPPVPEGHVRLYRGEQAGEGKAGTGAAEIRGATGNVPMGGGKPGGRWFTTDKRYASSYSGKGSVKYVDVPEDVARESYRGMMNPSGNPDVLHPANSSEFVIPKEHAAKAQPLEQTKAGKNLEEGSGHGEAESTFYQEGTPKHFANVPETDPEVAPPLTTDEVKSTARGAMKGVKKARMKTDEIMNAERGNRLREAGAAMRDSSVPDPYDRHLNALGKMKGVLPKFNWGGFSELSPGAVRAMLTHVQGLDTLMPGQALRVNEAIIKAFQEGRPFSHAERALMESIFGKDTVLPALDEVRGWGAHAREIAMEVLNIPRSVMASMDLSAPFRQGLVLGSRHPVIFSRNLKAMMQSAGSEQFYHDMIDAVHATPTIDMKHIAGLAITDMEHSGTLEREEQFAYSNLAEKILSLKPGDRNYSPIRWSGRAYTGFLVKFRSDVFDHLIEVAHAQGYDVHDTKFLKDLGTYINAATGRGDLGKWEGAANALNTFLFSPRLMASRLNFLNPAFYFRMNKFARRQALQSAFTTLSGVGTILGLASLIPGVTVGTDPRSANFAKIRFGDTRIDVAGGFQQELRLLGQIATGEAISSTTGREQALTGGKFGAATRLDILVRWAEGKASPPAGVGLDFLRGVDPQGKNFTWTHEAVSHLTPLLGQDSADLFHQYGGGKKGALIGAAGYLGGAWGAGIQTYGPSVPGKKTTEKYQAEAKQLGMQVPANVWKRMANVAEVASARAAYPKDYRKQADELLKYYAEQTGRHNLDRWIGNYMSDEQAKGLVSLVSNSFGSSNITALKRMIDARMKAKSHD